MSGIEADLLPVSEVDRLQEQVRSVYLAAFSPPPYRKSVMDADSFLTAFVRHRERDGFRFAAAYQKQNVHLVGIAYGYTSAPGQWWHDLVSRALPLDLAQTWLAYSFEFVELAVIPQFQGRGFGGCLHDILLTDQTHKTAVLSTLQMETTGLHLYRKRGWITLLDKMVFPNVPQLYQIMGLDLATRSEKKQ